MFLHPDNARPDTLDHGTRPGSHRGRRRSVRRVGAIALTAALVPAGTGLLDRPAQAADTVHVVQPGESVQAAVDAAAPGDIVELAPGSHLGSVRIATDNLTLRGPRTGDAVIMPAAGDASHDCATGGYGVCAFGTAERKVVGVRVQALTVTGFRKTGVMGRFADRLAVRGVRAHGNGEHGIGQEFSTQGSFSGNTAKDNAQSGLFVGDEAGSPGTAVSGNFASGNRIGVHLRRARHVAITGNMLTGNCAGAFLVGDETRPVAGETDIVGNTMTENNRYCPGNERIAHIQGSGIVLTGTQRVRITANHIVDNRGDSPMSGGIVMVPSFTGDATSHQDISHNTVLRNAPADLAERDPRTTGNRYGANTCSTSQPAGLCGPAQP